MKHAAQAITTRAMARRARQTIAMFAIGFFIIDAPSFASEPRASHFLEGAATPSSDRIAEGATGLASKGGIAQNPIVVPAIEMLDGGQLAIDAAWAEHESPGAFLAREDSTTRFEGLDTARAAAFASESFPGTFAKPAAPPEPPAGDTVISYPTDTAEQLRMPSGERTVFESTAPLALETSPGHREGINLAISQGSDSFTPTAPQCRSRSPSTCPGAPRSRNWRLPHAVRSGGHALSGSEGQIDGASVFYGGTRRRHGQRGRADASGFSLDSLLRSPRSPSTLYFRVGMPDGRESRVRQAAELAPYESWHDGQTIAMIRRRRRATRAAGPCRLTMHVRGDTRLPDSRPSSRRIPVPDRGRPGNARPGPPALGIGGRQKVATGCFISTTWSLQGGGCACDSEWGILGVSATNATYGAAKGDLGIPDPRRL